MMAKHQEYEVTSKKVSKMPIFDFIKNSDIKKTFKPMVQGSEAKIYTGLFLGKEAVLKERFTKNYRHPDLDRSLTSERIKAEIRALNKCFDIGIKCPAVYFVDLQIRCIILEQIPDSMTVKELLMSEFKVQGIDGITSLLPLAHKIGADIAKMHQNDLVHGDLTTSNILIKKNDTKNIFSEAPCDLYFIDFGLSKRDIVIEDKAVDLYVLERAISSSHPDSEAFYSAIMKSYFSVVGVQSPVFTKLEEVRQRGRKRVMVG